MQDSKASRNRGRNSGTQLEMQGAKILQPVKPLMELDRVYSTTGVTMRNHNKNMN